MMFFAEINTFDIMFRLNMLLSDHYCLPLSILESAINYLCV